MTRESDSALEAFGAAVRKRRHELGLSQESLADAAGLHRTYVADVERGTRNLSLLSILKLVQALDLSAERLFSADYFEHPVSNG